MGIVRRHPVVSALVVVLLSPVVAVGGVVVARYRPECSEWRAEVEEITDLRMRTRYLGDGDAQAFDRAYMHWETTYQDTRRDVRAQVALERTDSRPDLCL